MHHHHDPGHAGGVGWPRGARGRRGPRPFGPGPFFMDYGGPFGGHGPFGRGRARRGDVRAAVIALLAERPMHGYEMIQELESRTSGLWRPSPGSVYPTLQLLEDEGLVEHEEERGKRRYSLTDAGREVAAEREGAAPWDEVTQGTDPGALSLRESLRQLVGAFVQVARVGTPAQHQEAERILAEARRRLYTLLAEES